MQPYFSCLDNIKVESLIVNVKSIVTVYFTNYLHKKQQWKLELYDF